MRRKSGRLLVSWTGWGVVLGLLTTLQGPPFARGQEKNMTVTVGSTGANVVGTGNVAIQTAIDRVAAAGGGTVVIKAGTYLLANSVRLASHIRLRGEGPGKTVLKKAAGVKSKLKIDADYGEMIATVEDASGFAPGMGVTILDNSDADAWKPSVRTIVSIEGNTLHLDRFLQMDYSVARQGQVFNTFPLIAGFNVEDVQVEDLSVDGSRTGSGVLDGCQTAGIYFFHSQRMTLRNCVARDYPGDGISLQIVEDPVVDNCETEGNAQLGIHLGTGALRGIVRDCRVHDNGKDGLYLCWRVQHARYERNQSWNNGQDGISLGHKDTDNIFIGNSSSGNARAGIYFRDEDATNAASRNTFEGNTLEDNGRPGEAGYAIRIEGETRDLKFVSNTIRSGRIDGVVVQPVGIYIGPKADRIMAGQNLFMGEVEKAILDESQGGHNQLDEPHGR
jgi:hypothetical protein